MILRSCLAAVVIAVVLAGHAVAQEESQPAVARELARLMMDSTARRVIDEQVRAGMIQALTVTLQQRLNRRLYDAEVNQLAEIVRQFLTQALPPSRTEAIAAEVYRRHFEESELREILAFQRTPVARKASELAPLIALETAQAIDAELRNSAALPDTLAALHHAFPVLGRPESP